jgi:hypothetical protein
MAEVGGCCPVVVPTGPAVGPDPASRDASSPARIHVPQHHVGFAEAREIAEAHDLPVHSDGPEKGGAGDVIIGDVVDLEASGARVAQQHVGGVAAVEAAEGDEGPIDSDLA